MIFVRLFCDNFLSTLFHIHIMFLLSLFLFLSLLFFTNKKRERKSCHKNYLNCCSNITTLVNIQSNILMRVRLNWRKKREYLRHIWTSNT